VRGSALGYLADRVQFPGIIPMFVVLQALFVGVYLAWGPREQRRSHFWARIVISSVSMAIYTAVLVGVNQLNVLSDDVATKLLVSLFIVGVIAQLLVGGLFYRASGSSSDPRGSDSDGGPGPRPPDFSPDPPRGGVPLLDADQARTRARDHTAPRFAGLTRRRPAHEPVRTPARTTE
jgi:hypothetical protein